MMMMITMKMMIMMMVMMMTRMIMTVLAHIIKVKDIKVGCSENLKIVLSSMQEILDCMCDCNFLDSVFT